METTTPCTCAAQRYVSDDEVEVALLALAASGEITVVGVDARDGLVFAHCQP